MSVFANAQAYINFDSRHKNSIIEGLDIEFLDVSSDGESCLFKINGSIYVINKGELETIGKAKLWVKDIYPLHTKENNDVCVVLVAGVEIIDRNEQSETKEIVVLKNETLINKQVTEEINEEQNLINKEENENNIENNTILFVPEANTQEIEKTSFFQRIISFFRNLFS